MSSRILPHYKNHGNTIVLLARGMFWIMPGYISKDMWWQAHSNSPDETVNLEMVVTLDEAIRLFIKRYVEEAREM
jgi:hypothetical protein